MKAFSPVVLSSLRQDRARSTPDEVMRTCPNCGKALQDRKCKLFCPDPRCGYFLSCADFH